MKDTKNEIIRLANELIRSIGYNAFSYADISKQLNIKNAAIHYYFPAKSDLGIEIIKQNIKAFDEKICKWELLDSKQQYINYIRMHDGFVNNQWICIVGSLASSYETLPEEMQRELQILASAIIEWLTGVLDKGKQAKVFSFEETPKQKAYMVHAALLSALLMNKVLGNEVYTSIQDGLLDI